MAKKKSDEDSLIESLFGSGSSEPYVKRPTSDNMEIGGGPLQVPKWEKEPPTVKGTSRGWVEGDNQPGITFGSIGTEDEKRTERLMRNTPYPKNYATPPKEKSYRDDLDEKRKDAWNKRADLDAEDREKMFNEFPGTFAPAPGSTGRDYGESTIKGYKGMYDPPSWTTEGPWRGYEQTERTRREDKIEDARGDKSYPKEPISKDYRAPPMDLPKTEKWDPKTGKMVSNDSPFDNYGYVYTKKPFEKKPDTVKERANRDIWGPAATEEDRLLGTVTGKRPSDAMRVDALSRDYQEFKTGINQQEGSGNWSFKRAMGLESIDEKMRRAGPEAYGQYLAAKKEQDISKSLNKQSLGDIMTARGMIGWVGARKTEWDSASIGGMPQDKIEYRLVPDKYDAKTGKPSSWKKELQFVKARIDIPIKTKTGWSTTPVEANTANLRLAIDRRKQMKAETEHKEEIVKHKTAETANIRALIEARDQAEARRAGRFQSEKMGRMERGSGVYFGTKNFGRDPIYLVNPGDTDVRARYTIGIAPNVRAGLVQNRRGLSRMSERAISNNSAPMTINPLMRVGLPDVVGNRMQLDPRYVTGPQVPSGISNLSVTGGQSGVLGKLSAFRKKRQPEEF